MRSLKEDLEILKVDNLKLMNPNSNQEEINELLLKNLTDPPKHNCQNSCSTGKKRKGVVQNGSSEETTDDIPVTIPDLKKDNELKIEKKKDKHVELQE